MLMSNQINCLLPAKCGRCGELFDMAYDLDRGEKEETFVRILSAKRGTMRRTLLCWDCRLKK